MVEACIAWAGFNDEPKWSSCDFEPGDKLVVEVAEGGKGVERLDSGWEWPIIDEIEFGFSWGVAFSVNVVANEFEATFEEVAFT